MLRLRRYDFNLKGGYQYEQPETKMRFDGNTAWRAQLRVIRKHRLGNHLPRTELTEIAEDLEAYTCNRLPNFCADSTANASRLNALASRGTKAGGCGHCGGRKKK